MTKTEQKLHYSKYFLYETLKYLRQSDSKYEPNLNAFVTFARSVGNVMMKEFSKYPGFIKWNKKTKRKI